MCARVLFHNLCASAGGPKRPHIDLLRHVAERPPDAVIPLLCNHGDGPLSDVLCLLASLSKRNKPTRSQRDTDWQAALAGFMKGDVLVEQLTK